ncbi:Ig-like domain repeat protein [Pseudonocardia sp. CA-142604]|uniref:Ig-like domain repeat protein n=1 Tax=Pseudonocardia sp. CA-142604 TaxID=3240024 RepID=UPI003D90D332
MLAAVGTTTALVVLPAAGGTAAAAVLPPECSQTGPTVTCTYTFTGAEQSFTVPSGTTSVQVSAIGAAGAPSYGGASGGRGAQVTGTLTGLTADQVLYVEVGGTPTNTAACYPLAACIGGFNGGGTSRFGGGGGGASDVRTVPSAQPNSLASRLIVAGAGGGGGIPGIPPCDPTFAGTPGGDADAAGGTNSCAGVGTSTGGGPGTQVTGGTAGSPSGDPGTLGVGGNGGGNLGGGGGGGLFGGGGGGSIIFSGGANTAGGGGGGGSSLVPAGGTASLTTAPASVTITYTSPISTTTLAVSPNPAVVGQPVTLTATVTCSVPTDTGTVTFYDGDAVIGTDSVTGSDVATLTTSSLSIGSHTLTAKFVGGTACLPSTSNTVVEVIQQGSSTATLTASPPNPSFGQPVTLTAQVSCTAGGAPTGTVTFSEGATAIGTVPLGGSGNAGLTVSGLPSGSHTFTAHYNGDTNCAPTTSNAVTVTAGCQSISGTHLGPLAVTGPVCLGPGTQILGPVTISGSGSLNAEGAIIQGPLIATSGTGLRVCATTVNGPTSISGINGVIVIGDAGDDGSPPCGANTLRGAATLRGNTGFVELGGNQILGPLTVNDNTTTISVPPENATATEIEANRIVGILACSGNTPPPTNDGRPNTVIGIRTGQCAAL